MTPIKYDAILMLKYSKYLKDNNLEDINEEMLEKWEASIIDSYETKIPKKDIINFFAINKKHINDIEHNRYKITIIDTQIDKLNLGILFTLELDITK